MSGASSIGNECLRRIQWDWRHPWKPDARLEAGSIRSRPLVRVLCARAVAERRLCYYIRGSEFSVLDGRFAGHADGCIVSGPNIPGLGYPCLWECKGLGSKGWNKLHGDKLLETYPIYADQVAVYQAYLRLDEHPALFTAGNMDTMEILRRLVPFDAERAQKASDKAVTVVRADQAGEVLPRVTDNPDDYRCRLCPHRLRCWGAESWDRGPQ